jgi:hypothetical protein
LTDDNLAWEIMRDHYKALYYGSPGFREQINWQAGTYRELMHASWQFFRLPDLTKRREEVLRTHHERHVTAFQKVVNEIKRQRPATAAEERHRGAEAVVSPVPLEKRRLYESVLWARLNAHRQIRSNWYWKNQAQLEGAKT